MQITNADRQTGFCRKPPQLPVQVDFRLRVSIPFHADEQPTRIGAKPAKRSGEPVITCPGRLAAASVSANATRREQFA